DGGYELAPAVTLRREHGAPRRREAIETAPPLPGFLHPSTRDPAAVLHSIEQRIERRDVEGEHPLGAGLDHLLELVAVPRLRLEEGQDEKLGASLFQLVGKHGSPICGTHIYTAAAIRGVNRRIMISRHRLD